MSKTKSEDPIDLVVIGGGPGGYSAAIRAAQLGMKATVVEVEENLGGICLNWGCIPTKALLKSAHLYSQAAHLKEFGIEVTGIKLNWTAVQKRKEKILAQLNKGIFGLMKKNKVQVLQGFGTLRSATSVEVNGEVHSARAVMLATGSEPFMLPSLTGPAVISSNKPTVDKPGKRWRDCAQYLISVTSSERKLMAPKS